jgi:tRNA modification GTPase
MSDTIAAISTAVGTGAISVVRLSGPRALDIADRVFSGRDRPPEASHRTILMGEILASDGAPIDQVLLLVMRSPGTYTGEDVVEITCHGGLAAPALVLRRLLESGARPAEPGEFTRRAFLNGKMDLAQAEAVSHLIHARSEKALKVAMRHIRGGLSAAVARAERALLGHLALIEANIDFPEDEVDAVDGPGLAGDVERIRGDLESLRASHNRGKLLRNGVDAVIVGKPNVGKSSLFNSLMGEDRVIVSRVPGTTRDVVEASLAVDGLVVNLHDTAGVAHPGFAAGSTGTGSPQGSAGPCVEVEAAAAAKTRAALEAGHIVLVVLDAALPLDAADAEILRATTGRPRVAVFNKVDLSDRGEHVGAGPEVRVSALKGWGLQSLRAELRRSSESLVGDLAEDIITNERHCRCLDEAVEALERAGSGLERDLPLELIASDLRAALLSLGNITGSNASDDLLEEIFSRFCIGK